MKIFKERGEEKLLTLGTIEEQLIDPDEWTNIEQFLGMSTNLILNPHVWLAFTRSLNSYTPTSGTLVLVQCGVSKPYTANQNKQWLMNGCFQESPLYDLAFLSIVPIIAFPLNAAVSYPFFFMKQVILFQKTWKNLKKKHQNSLYCFI